MLSGLTCPIGVAGISGKHPAEIAIAVAAQLLQMREQAAKSVKPLRLCNVEPGNGYQGAP